MKIYIAELMIISDDNNDYEVTFSFEESRRDFEFNETTNEFVYFKDWVADRVPRKMSIEPSMWGGFKIVQGFTKDLNDEELSRLEESMRALLIAKLDYEKRKKAEMFDKKIDTLKTKESRKFIERADENV